VSEVEVRVVSDVGASVVSARDVVHSQIAGVVGVGVVVVVVAVAEVVVVTNNYSIFIF
jgi:hypothetical protein